jgi:hypothetical protein
MQNAKFWKQFYENTKSYLANKSTFAEYVYLKYLKPFNDDNICLKIAELGCGNCRDSVFFADKGNYVYAIDLFSSKMNQHEWVNLISDDALCVMQNFKLKTLVDLVYMRWFLHAIPYKEAEQLFVSSIHNLKQGGLICIEVRSINDEKLKSESVFNNEDGSYELSHKRWLYNKEMLFKLANDNGLEIVEYSQGFFSPISETETPNPLLIRFIVKKKNLPYYESSDNYKLYESVTDIKKAKALKSYEEMNFFNPPNLFFSSLGKSALLVIICSCLPISPMGMGPN